MLGIVKSHELWASNISFLNDRAEFQTGVDSMMRAVRDIASTGDADRKAHAATIIEAVSQMFPRQSIYIASWSTQTDDLGQWRAYSGSGTGFEITMKWAVLKALADAQDFMFAKCIYDPEEQMCAAKEIVETSVREMVERRAENRPGTSAVEGFLLRLLRFAPLFKHAAFKSEDEWRLVSSHFQTEMGPNFGVREGRAIPVPYLRFRLKAEGSSVVDISQIRVGPCAEAHLAQQATMAAMLKYLPVYHGRKTAVSTSAVPYRNW
jgi:hypothetical protein